MWESDCNSSVRTIPPVPQNRAAMFRALWSREPSYGPPPIGSGEYSDAANAAPECETSAVPKFTADRWTWIFLGIALIGNGLLLKAQTGTRLELMALVVTAGRETPRGRSCRRGDTRLDPTNQAQPHSVPGRLIGVSRPTLPSRLASVVPRSLGFALAARVRPLQHVGFALAEHPGSAYWSRVGVHPNRQAGT